MKQRSSANKESEILLSALRAGRLSFQAKRVPGVSAADISPDNIKDIVLTNAPRLDDPNHAVNIESIFSEAQ